MCLGETVAGRIEDALEHVQEAQAAVDFLSNDDLAPRLEALCYLAWAETYLERYDDALAAVERGIAIARATGAGALLVPLQLARNFPLEMQGRLSEAIECCETALESAQVSASPHDVYRALFELGWTRYFAGDLDGVIAAYEESARFDPRLAGATIPNGGGGPGWGSGSRGSSPGGSSAVCATSSASSASPPASRWQGLSSVSNESATDRTRSDLACAGRGRTLMRGVQVRAERALGHTEQMTC